MSGHTFQMVVWCSGNVLVSINEVNLRRAPYLVLGWVAVSGFNSGA